MPIRVYLNWTRRAQGRKKAKGECLRLSGSDTMLSNGLRTSMRDVYKWKEILRETQAEIYARVRTKKGGRRGKGEAEARMRMIDERGGVPKGFSCS